MSGEKVEVISAAGVQDAFNVATVYKMFTDFFSSESTRIIDRGMPYSIVMGRNRYEFLKYGGFAKPIGLNVSPDNEDAEVKAKTGKNVSDANEKQCKAEWKYKTSMGSFDLKYKATYKFAKTENTADRVYLSVSRTDKNYNERAVTYPVHEKTRPIKANMKQFFLTAIMGTSMYHADALDSSAYTLPDHIEPTTAAGEILNNAFFQCPYYDIKYVKQTYINLKVSLIPIKVTKIKEEQREQEEARRKKIKEFEKFADDNERQIFNDFFQREGTFTFGKDKEVDLKKLILDDLYLQKTFCKEIIGRSEVRQQAGLFPDSLGRYYGANLNLFYSAIRILNWIDSIARDLERQVENVALYYYDNQKGFADLASAYQDLLLQLLKVALRGGTDEKCQQGVGLINAKDKAVLVVKRFPGYRTILHIIAFLSCGQEEETITLNQFKTLYNGVANSESIAFELVEGVIKGQSYPEALFLESLINSSIAFDQEDDSLRLLNRDFWQKSIASCGVEHSALFIPEEFKYDPEKFYSTCKNLLEEDKIVAESFDLDELQLNSFAADRSDNIFNIVQRGQEYYITVDIKPKEVGGYVVCPVPMFAGIYYQMIPNWDLATFNRFCFSLRSADQSLNEIKLELKSTKREEQTNYHFKPSAEWVEHTVDIETIPHNIKAGLEEICFILVPTFFTRNDLTASFSLKDMRFE